MKDFIRKVSFGIGPEEKVPTDPLNWAKNQLNYVPQFKWDGKKIYTEKELREFQNMYSLKERKKIRDKYKNDPGTLKKEQRKLALKTGRGYWINLELGIRHTEAIYGNSPVLTKLWYFWANHFTISSIKQFQQENSNYLISNHMKNSNTKVKTIEKEKVVAETLNGRFAMLGLIAAVGAYLTTGQIIPGFV